MQSNNPVFRRSETFNGQTNAYGNQTTSAGTPYAGYGDPSTWGTGTPGGPAGRETYARSTKPMTIDSVVQSTAIAFLVVLVGAVATWVLTPDIEPNMPASDLSGIFAALTVGGLAAFGLSLVNSFKRVVSPALVIAFCAAEGVALGALSKVFDAQYGEHIIINAVIGTFAAFAGTLAAYKFFDIQVGSRFRKWVVAAMFGFVAVSLLDFVLGMFSNSFGFNGFGPMGLISSFIGLGLGVLMLILDFDFVERGIQAGLPERESWRAAFGLTVTIIWIYIELLRILAILRGND